MCLIRGDFPRGLGSLKEWARQTSEPSLHREGAYVTQYVDRASGEPARRKAYRSGISTVAGGAVMNHAG
jgi:hypothetical protein